MNAHSFLSIFNLGIQKNIKPYKIICSSNVCSWQSIELKKLIQTKKDLWHNLIKRRAHNYESRDDALIYYKNVRKKCREKIKFDIKKYESNIVNNFKVHPKLLYKYIKDKMNIKESIKEINGDDGTVLHNPKDICHKFNSWFHSVFQAEDLSHIHQVVR